MKPRRGSATSPTPRSSGWSTGGRGPSRRTGPARWACMPMPISTRFSAPTSGPTSGPTAGPTSEPTSEPTSGPTSARPCAARGRHEEPRDRIPPQRPALHQ
uniref:PT domain-containing protein n=1 Tax=Cupriavidus cauae TaxID=2608999 RepID=UPI001680606F